MDLCGHWGHPQNPAGWALGRSGACQVPASWLPHCPSSRFFLDTLYLCQSPHPLTKLLHDDDSARLHLPFPGPRLKNPGSPNMIYKEEGKNQYPSRGLRESAFLADGVWRSVGELYPGLSSTEIHSQIPTSKDLSPRVPPHVTLSPPCPFGPTLWTFITNVKCLFGDTGFGNRFRLSIPAFKSSRFTREVAGSEI